MFHHFLAFLLINTCYQSLGYSIKPSTPSQLLSKSLATLASQCENTFLSNQLKTKIQDCAIFVPPYSKKQFQCLIFYDINMQLCSAVASSKLALNDDYLIKINEKQDVNDVCTLAKDWVFTNISDFIHYKESAEKYFKLPATCGEVCGVEDTMNEANFYCKYYKWGIEMLKSQVSAITNNANNNAVAAPVIPEAENAKADIPVPINSIQLNPKDNNMNTKTLNGQIKQTESAIAKTTPQKLEEAVEEEAEKPGTTVQVASKQTPSLDGAESVDKVEDANANVNEEEDPSVALAESAIPNSDLINKSSIPIAEKPVVANDLLVADKGKGVPVNAEPKEAVLENPKPKAMSEGEDYGDSDGNDNVGEDDGGEEPGLEIKSDQDGVPNTFVRNKLIVPHDGDTSQKEYFPNTIPDGFSEDNDHFFPFFMTSIVLLVLLYVLYHNKSKVSKVFFGLILEGRQGGRRRNSRGHAYRRLDTLEQAMSANTAAPPSKIIY